jgi:hypothetical protein
MEPKGSKSGNSCVYIINKMTKTILNTSLTTLAIKTIATNISFNKRPYLATERKTIYNS